jgi:hypothetical protein
MKMEYNLWLCNVRIMQQWGAFVQPPLHWKCNKYYNICVCICSLRYPACNAHTSYYHLWPALLYNIFPLFLIKGMILGKKVTQHKVCLSSFSTTSFWNISDIWYIYIFNLQLVWHPVAAVQYTFTHKQYTEYRERNIHNNHKIKHT